MSKLKTIFFCKSCGYESPKWVGKCPACQEWNTLIESNVQKKNNSSTSFNTMGIQLDNQPQRLDTIEIQSLQRLVTPDKELNRVLGGGIVPGSVVLVSGEPGIGKSTLFLQCALNWQACRVLYVSGEESLQQIKMRSERMQGNNPELYLMNANKIEDIVQAVHQIQPQLLIIDSIQTMETTQLDSTAGSITQVRESTTMLIKLAKAIHLPVFLIGHITKDGVIAGPKVLEHMVDTVIQFEGDRHFAYRMLRGLKNRFGSAAELGIYEMTASGLTEVPNPSEILISQNEEPYSGIALSTVLQGQRPLVIEVQALVSNSVYGTPQRTATGIEPKRLQLLLAVLEKRGGFAFGQKDVFINIAGGLKLEDTSVDLALVAALLSSYEEQILPDKCAFIGEVGLSGEIRPVNRIEQRLLELEKLGVTMVYMPYANLKGLELTKYKMEIWPFKKLEDFYRHRF